MDIDNPTALLVDRDRAAAILGVKPSVLRKWYYQGRGPAATKLGDTKQGRVMYAIPDLEAWVLSGAPMDKPCRPASAPVGAFQDPRGPEGRFVSHRTLESIAS
jgi:hypothetical protein